MLSKPEIIELYKQGFSTRQIATKLGHAASCVYRIIQEAGISRSQSEAAILRQPAYSKHWRSSRQAARKVWERNIGPIPKGYHIHHIDRDHTNNILSNLECIYGPEHNSRHSRGSEYNIPRHLRPKRKEYMKQYLASYRKRNA